VKQISREVKLPELAGGNSRLNRERLNETANIRTYQVANSFVWFKGFRLMT
jgi:hypothetical protein